MNCLYKRRKVANCKQFLLFSWFYFMVTVKLTFKCVILSTCFVYILPCVQSLNGNHYSWFIPVYGKEGVDGLVGRKREAAGQAGVANLTGVTIKIPKQ